MQAIRSFLEKLTRPEPKPHRRFEAKDDEYIQYLIEQRRESSRVIERRDLAEPVTPFVDDIFPRNRRSRRDK